SARDVVAHVVETQGIFLGLVGRQLGDIPAVDDAPGAAARAATNQTQAGLDDPRRATEEFDGHFGRSTYEQAVDRFLSVDLVIHRWDLARAAGLDDELAPDDVARLRDTAQGFGDALRESGACGPALEPPPGADEQTRLLAFLGRKAWA
ncbi:MAG: TIGR03086 family protein, partial [Egibacteraceae bacterium]